MSILRKTLKGFAFIGGLFAVGGSLSGLVDPGVAAAIAGAAVSLTSLGTFIGDYLDNKKFDGSFKLTDN